MQDDYRAKASECLDLANKAGGGWNRFFAMAIMWLRLAEESERLKSVRVGEARQAKPD